MILSFMLLCMWNISSPFSKNKMRNSRERPPKGGCFLARNSQKYVAIHSNHWYNHIEYFFYTRKEKTKKKKIIALLMVAMVATLAGCGSSGTKETKKAEEKKPTYESVYKEYSQKMKDATPGLIEEYKKDAEGVSDMNKLANISAKKTEKLANICAKGGKRLAAIHTKENDDEDKYNEWMNKLTDVYQDEAQKITDAYQDSILG